MITVPNHQFSRMLNTHPVLLLSSRMDRSNTVAPITWYIPVSHEPPLIGLSLKPSTLSYHYIRTSGDFILAVPNPSQLKTVQFCGVHSGRHLDKIFVTNLSTTRAKAVSPLMLTDGLANIECRVRDIYSLGDRPLIVGEILSIYVDPYSYEDGWNADVELIHHVEGNHYRIGNDVIDMSLYGPGYIPPNTVL